jgi:16S rRNA (adenine1518-N6/adenine1519-N6)-dimethyltransferase
MSARKPVNGAKRRSRTSFKAPLGQNFLADAGAASRIVDALGDIGSSVVIEIGAGRGALTKLLAPRAGHLIATELDEMLASKLRAAYAGQQNVEIAHANFLKISLSDILNNSGKLQPWSRVKIVGNIPYYITSDILLRLLEQHELIERAVLMVQREVADRIAAEPASRDYGLLTCTTELFANAERLFTLPPSAFSPPPQVHSSVIRLTINPKAARLGINAEEFLNFCKLAFAQKRKTLFNNLRRRYDENNVRGALSSIQVRDDARAEMLSLEQLALVFLYVREHKVDNP